MFRVPACSLVFLFNHSLKSLALISHCLKGNQEQAVMWLPKHSTFPSSISGCSWELFWVWYCGLSIFNPDKHSPFFKKAAGVKSNLHVGGNDKLIRQRNTRDKEILFVLYFSFCLHAESSKLVLRNTFFFVFYSGTFFVFHWISWMPFHLPRCLSCLGKQHMLNSAAASLIVLSAQEWVSHWNQGGLEHCRTRDCC